FDSSLEQALSTSNVVAAPQNESRKRRRDIPVWRAFAVAGGAGSTDGLLDHGCERDRVILPVRARPELDRHPRVVFAPPTHPTPPGRRYGKYGRGATTVPGPVRARARAAARRRRCARGSRA